VEPDRDRLGDPERDLLDVLDPEHLELALEREDVELFRARGVELERDLLVEPLRDQLLELERDRLLVESERDRLLDPDRVDCERVDGPVG
jgi:hypothetical protein